ncbi:hypothetical protein H9636_16055 [Ureibacillus sp. Re31]|uniref:YD repeat-containing protein n=1 Tax=Ureibacillus galli TaxID=2762222 RepID=A0ABR8XG15_9BACL|nr:hypothetical protein [Ureibacillus galli]MBD8028162.1 hypothetical protein [Ureibacillus galli]
MFYELFWEGYNTFVNKFCNTFEKTVEIAKQYTKDENFLYTHDLTNGCIINKYELDVETGMYNITEQYEYDADTDELNKMKI